MLRTIIESPYAGDIPRNLRYLRAAMRDALKRGEAPYASHALYTQPGVLDDTDPAERALGMEAGFAWGPHANLVTVYQDLGITDGMRLGIACAEKIGLRVEYRNLDNWDVDHTPYIIRNCPDCPETHRFAIIARSPSGVFQVQSVDPRQCEGQRFKFTLTQAELDELSS